MSDEKQKTSEPSKKKFSIAPILAKFKGLKHKQLIIAGALTIVVIILVFSSFNSLGSSNSKNNTQTQDQTATATTEDYTADLERRLTNVLSGIKGCEDVRVMIITENTPEIVYAEHIEERTTGSGDSKQTTIIRYPATVKNGSNETPLVVMEVVPKIAGVLIVTKGATDTAVRLKIISAVQALLSVDAGRVEILS